MGDTPSQTTGFLVADARRHAGRELKVDPGNQTWRKIPPAHNLESNGDCHPALYLGFWNDARPTPEDLLRPAPAKPGATPLGPIDGYLWTLGDGRRWQLPLVREFDAAAGCWTTSLPCSFEYDERGKLKRGSVIQTYRWLVEASESAWQRMTSEADISEDEALATLGVLIGANYAAGAAELMALGCFTEVVTETPRFVLSIMLDYSVWLEWAESQKKSEVEATRAGCDTSAGRADSTPATPQLAPIS
jgi:hypothetical protein